MIHSCSVFVLYNTFLRHVSANSYNNIKKGCEPCERENEQQYLLKGYK